MAIRRSAPTANDYLPDSDDLLPDEPDVEPSGRAASLQAGWGPTRKALEETSQGFVNEFKFTEDPQVVKFRNEGEPIAHFRQHWLDGKEGKKSYACLGSIKEKCPLCTILGHQPSVRVAFSILRLGEEGITSEALVVGPRLAGSLDKFHTDPRHGPLDRKFWALSRTGKGAKTQHQVIPVKESDLIEDWEIDPSEVAKAMTDLPPLDASFVRFESYADLAEIARSLAT